MNQLPVLQQRPNALPAARRHVGIPLDGRWALLPHGHLRGHDVWGRTNRAWLTATRPRAQVSDAKGGVALRTWSRHVLNGALCFGGRGAPTAAGSLPADFCWRAVLPM